MKKWNLFTLMFVCTVVMSGGAHAQNSSAAIRRGGKADSGVPSGAKWDEIRAKRERAFRLENQGRMLQKRGDLKGAISAYGEATRLDKSAAGAYIGLAEVYGEAGDWKKAAASYRVVMYRWEGKTWGSSLSNSYEDILGFVTVLHKAGDTREAQTMYRKAVGMAPKQMIPFLYLPAANQGFDEKKMLASLHLSMSDLAEYQRRNGKKSEAEANLAKRLREVEQAIVIAPDYAPAHLMLGEALEYQSKRDSFYKRPEKAKVSKIQALQAYKRAASLGKGGTKVAAQKGMQSSWFEDITKAAP